HHRVLHSFPTRRSSDLGFRRSFAFAGEMMDRGYSLMVFPEGERTKHGAMNPFKSGAGILIKELETWVVPMRIDGLWRLKQANRQDRKSTRLNSSHVEIS